MKIRPPWVSASLKPNDLDKSFYAFLHGANPNDPKLPKSALVYHNKWGIVRKNHEMALSKSHDFDLGLGSAHRKEGHRLMTVGTITITSDQNMNTVFNLYFINMNLLELLKYTVSSLMLVYVFMNILIILIDQTISSAKIGAQRILRNDVYPL